MFAISHEPGYHTALSVVEGLQLSEDQAIQPKSVKLTLSIFSHVHCKERERVNLFIYAALD